MEINATIYWDDQAIGNEGWAFATRVDGEHDATGPVKTLTMEDLPEDASDEDLIAALRDSLTEKAAAALSDDNITIKR